MGDKTVQMRQHELSQGIGIKPPHSMHRVGLQLVHQVEIDELLLDSHTLVIYDISKEPEGLPAEMQIVGGEESCEDGREVRVPHQAEADRD